MKLARLACLAVLVGAFLTPATTHALSLEIKPLSFKTELKDAEKKKGFLDITNTDVVSHHIKTEVQAFRQVDDQGALQFYDDERVAAGITPDLDEFELKPRETIRMYFLVDGAKLPQGDVFGALFLRTVPEDQVGVAGSLRVGTLLSIVNGTPGDHHAEVTSFDVPFWQFGSTVQGTYRVKNTSDPSKSTGFYPEVSLTVRPSGVQQTKESTLVFAGRERENTLAIEAADFGLASVTLEYNGKRIVRPVFLVTPLLIVVCAAVIVVAVGVGIFVRRKMRKRTR